MNIQRYEALILASPEITHDESGELERSIDRKIQEYKGTLISYDRWGKYQLAYPIKHHEYGVYFLVRLEVPKTNNDLVLKEIKNIFDLKFNTTVMRYVFSHLDETASLEYKRPLSLEEKPRDVGFFNKEGRGGHDSHRSFDRNPAEARPAQPVSAPMPEPVTTDEPVDA